MDSLDKGRTTISVESVNQDLLKHNAPHNDDDDDVLPDMDDLLLRRRASRVSRRMSAQLPSFNRIKLNTKLPKSYDELEVNVKPARRKEQVDLSTSVAEFNKIRKSSEPVSSFTNDETIRNRLVRRMTDPITPLSTVKNDDNGQKGRPTADKTAVTDTRTTDKKVQCAMITARLCQDYVFHKLRKNGYKPVYESIPLTDAITYFKIFDALLKIGGILERGVSSVFSSISASIDVSFDDTDTVSRVYSVLAKRIMGGEQDQWSWGRIVALIAISASIGLDCADRMELVEFTILHTCEYFSDNLLTWIQTHGGWTKLIELAKPRKIISERTEENKKKTNIKDLKVLRHSIIEFYRLRGLSVNLTIVLMIAYLICLFYFLLK